MQPWRRALGAAGPFLRAARGAHGGAGERGRGAALAAGPDLRHFLAGAAPPPPGRPEQGPEPGPCVAAGPAPAPRKVYLETYGCQMNVNDTEIAWAILQKSGYTRTKALDEADVILLVTCSVREKAEQAIWNRLQHLKALKARRLQARLPLHIGILGCMAERLKEKILHREKLVDIVAGPDAYRDLPRLLTVAESGQQAANVLLSLEETYADILPVQTSAGGTTAFVSIMRGCDNMCSYCIVPFTRGRERSRPIASILQEVKMLSDQGVKEVTLLGQNVNSFRDLSEVHFQSAATPVLSRGFSTVYKAKPGGLRFAHLLDQVSRIDPEMRIRFTSPHPKDFPDEVLQLIQERHNICKQLHLPAQSGSTRVLEAMRRGYTREAYLELVHHVRDSIPGVSLSSDFIAGFCGETEEDHQQTVSLLQEVRYNVGFLFAYSMRQKTRAYHRLQDDVPADVKQRRLEELITVFREEAARTNRAMVGHSQLVLVEGGFSHLASKNLGPNSKTAIREVTRLGILYGTGCKEPSKRSASELCGRNDGNIKVIFPDAEIEDAADCKALVRAQPGDYVLVKPEKLMSAEQVIPTNSAEFWSCKNLQHPENTTPITAVEGQHKETTQRTEDFDDFFQILITSPFANAWKGRHENPEFQGSLSPPQRFIPFYYWKLKCFYTSVPH